MKIRRLNQSTHNGNAEATQGMLQCIKVAEMWPREVQTETGKHPARKSGAHCIFYLPDLNKTVSAQMSACQREKDFRSRITLLACVYRVPGLRGTWFIAPGSYHSTEK